MYTEKQLAAVAKRENNTKRSYLVVNCLQGKHIPVSPKQFFDMTKALADQVQSAYPEEQLLLVGFAETATAIGAALAVYLDTPYIQTTREPIEDVSWLYFTESHSHATEQKLVREDIASAIDRVDRIVFVEDEVTTGNTIRKIVDIIDREFDGKVQFSVASLLNGMDAASYDSYVRRNIGVHYLVKTDHSGYTAIADSFAGDGEYVPCGTDSGSVHTTHVISGAQNARRLVQGTSYRNACESLWQSVQEKDLLTGSSVLVIGTEECMYPALYAAKCAEEAGFTVRSHSTTRSPIAVSREEDYPLHRRFTLASLYDPERTTYIYDIGSYDTVLIITDAPCTENSAASLIHALASCGNKNIHLIHWC